MHPDAMTFVFVVGILGLLVLDHDKGIRASKALWIPVAWLFINCSRPVSMWRGGFGFWSPLSTAEPPETYLEGKPLYWGVFSFLFVSGVFGLVPIIHTGRPFFPPIWALCLFFF